jgi:hypothetical protein
VTGTTTNKVKLLELMINSIYAVVQIGQFTMRRPILPSELTEITEFFGRIGAEGPGGRHSDACGGIDAVCARRAYG